MWKKCVGALVMPEKMRFQIKNRSMLMKWLFDVGEVKMFLLEELNKTQPGSVPTVLVKAETSTR